MVKTFHIKRFFGDPIHRCHLVDREDHIRFDSLDLIPSTFLWNLQMPFQNISYAQTALKFRLIFAFDLSRFLRSKFV